MNASCCASILRNFGATVFLIRSLGLPETGVLVDCGTSSIALVPYFSHQPHLVFGDEDRFFQRFSTGEGTAVDGVVQLTADDASYRLRRVEGRVLVDVRTP